MTEASETRKSVATLLAGAVFMAAAGGWVVLNAKLTADNVEAAAPVSTAKETVGSSPEDLKSPPSSSEGLPPLSSAKTKIPKEELRERQAELPMAPPVAWQVRPFTEFYAKGGATAEQPAPVAQKIASPAVEIREFEQAQRAEQAAAKATAAAEAEQRKPRPLGDFFKK